MQITSCKVNLNGFLHNIFFYNTFKLDNTRITKWLETPGEQILETL